MRFVLTLTLGALSCLPTIEIEQPPRCDVADGGVSTPSGRAALVGVKTTVISSRRSPQCPPSIDLQLAATVTDPLQRPVAAEVAGPFARGTFVTAEVSFTPAMPGLHRIDVSFDSMLGRATSDVLAVEAVTLGRRLGTLERSVECLAEDVTSAGAWVCLERSGTGSRASFWRQGQQLQAVPATQLQIVGDVVWIFRPGEVERFVDSGGSVLVRSPDAILRLDTELADSDVLVAVDRSAFFAVKGGDLTFVELQADRLARGTTVAVPRGLCPGSVRVMPESPSNVAITCGSRLGFVRFCRLPLARPGDTACVELEGQLVGAAPSGVWTTLDRSIAFSSLDAGVSLSLPPGYAVTPSRRLAATFSPIVTDASQRTFLPVARGQLSLSALPDGLTLLGVGADRLLLEGTATRILTAPAP